MFYWRSHNSFPSADSKQYERILKQFSRCQHNIDCFRSKRKKSAL